MSNQQPLKVVLSQIDAARKELDSYPPSGFGWYKRSRETAKLLVPWLTGIAPRLKTYVEEVVNSKRLVRSSWQKIKSVAGKRIPADLVVSMDHELELEGILLDTVGGDVMSKVIEKFLIENSPNADLESNGRSDYPDLFLRSKNYSLLPAFKKLKGESGGYGAALKGKSSRPVRIPDGLEVKTCRNSFNVDCHHAHAGLHLALLCHGRQGSLVVTDIQVAYLQHSDYRITKPASPTTTLKASFNGKQFVSLFMGRVPVGDG